MGVDFWKCDPFGGGGGGGILPNAASSVIFFSLLHGPLLAWALTSLRQLVCFNFPASARVSQYTHAPTLCVFISSPDASGDEMVAFPLSPSEYEARNEPLLVYIFKSV